MDFWLDIFSLVAGTLLHSLGKPFFWLVVLIVFMQYRRAVSMERKLFGRAVNNAWLESFYSLLFGLLGGFFGSLFLLFLGISLESVGIVYLWPLALFLMLINPRFLCFAYAGGIVAVSTLILKGVLRFLPGLETMSIVKGLFDIHLPSLLALIGILHLTESFLIYFSGHRGASPIYLKTSSGEVLGGYSMQRFWPLPLMGLWAFIVADTSQLLVGGIPMPAWWPLLGATLSVGGNEQVVYLIIPLVAGLGYSDLALSSYPRSKRITTAKNLALYSIILSLAAISAVHIPFMIVPAALLAPLGHEFIIKKANREEFSRPPLFSADGKGGLKILAVMPGAPAGRAGLRCGDRLIKIDDVEIVSEQDLWNGLRLSHGRIYLQATRGSRKIDFSLPACPQPLKSFGLILAPGKSAPVYVEMKQSSFLKRFKRKSK